MAHVQVRGDTNKEGRALGCIWWTHLGVSLLKIKSNIVKAWYLELQCSLLPVVGPCLDTSAQLKSKFLLGMKTPENQKWTSLQGVECLERLERMWTFIPCVTGATCTHAMTTTVLVSFLSSPRASAPCFRCCSNKDWLLPAHRRGKKGITIKNLPELWFRAASKPQDTQVSHSFSTNFRRLGEDDYPSLLSPSAQHG